MPQFSDAWAEAEANANGTYLVYETLELQHPSFIDPVAGAYPVRVVNGVPEDMALGIEQGARFTPGQMALFQAVMFEADPPEFGEGTPPRCRIRIDNAARIIAPIIEQAAAVRADLIVLFRQYRSDDLSVPCAGPHEFIVRDVTITDTTVEGTAVFRDLSNMQIIRRRYNPVDYPALGIQ